MAVIRPFRGIRYNQEKAERLECLVTPPYDVISPEDRQMYEELNPCNFVRLILPKDYPDSPGSRYKISAETLNGWLVDGTFIRDAEPSFYACTQEFEVKGERKCRTGFTCLVRLEDFEKGKVLPHENILAKPLEDRLNLMRETKSNFDSVFGLFSSREVNSILKNITSRTPDASVMDKDDVVCSIYQFSDDSDIQALTKALSNESIVIADGHHRYTAALAYRDEMRKSKPNAGPYAPWEYVLMTLVSMEDPGLVVFPTHRLVSNLESFNPDAFIGKVGQVFDIEDAPASKLKDRLDERSNENYTFGVYVKGKACIVSLRKDIKPENAIESNGSDALKRLDVSVLHSLILDKMLGIDIQKLSQQSNLSYTRNPEAAIKSIDEGQAQILILMNPTKVEEVKEVAAAGDRMPQKSTFFYPKLITGMIMRLIEED